MFKRLRVKLTVLYAGLFFLAWLFIGATAYAVIASNTQRQAREQLANSGAVFEQIWSMRLDHLQDSAFASAGSAAFQQAAAADDAATLAVALRDLRQHTRADVGFLVNRDGLIIGDSNVGTSVTPGLQVALQHGQTARGAIDLGGRLYQAVVAPLPLNQGWVVLGTAIGDDALGTVEHLSPMPVQATALIKSQAGWGESRNEDFDAINAFVAGRVTIEHARASQLRTPRGRFMALVQPLPSLDGTRSVLLLQLPLSSALSPYRAFFGTLLAIGLIGLILFVVSTWFLSRGITQPLSTLEQAAKQLQHGVYDAVVVRTQDEIGRVAESFNTMADAIRARERRITQLAYHDAEARLPNRLALERRLAAAQQPERLYFAAIGVDRFTHVRGAIGYALTNALIHTLGGRLARLAPNGPLGRLSSDMLGVAFVADSEADARKRAAAIVANLEESFSLDGQNVDVSVSVGVAQPREKGETPAAMIERASIALDQARAAKQKVAMFDKTAYGDPARNLSLMGEMRQALKSGELSLLHQPKYSFRTGGIVGAESLVRWRHPTRGMIPPDLFVPMAEETGNIRVLTEWVLQRAIEDQQKLSASGWPLTLSVNISARLLSDVEFAESAIAIARQAPHAICFEITETAVIDNPKVALENVERFAAAGLRVAIDDYGSGLSSLAYLKQLPAHELKIDKMFVESLTNSQRDALLVRSTIDLAHGLGMEVTAEGVETPAAFALLASMGCDHAQGYLVSRPATTEELVAILSDKRRPGFYQQTAATGVQQPPLGDAKTA